MIESNNNNNIFVFIQSHSDFWNSLNELAIFFNIFRENLINLLFLENYTRFLSICVG